MKRALFAFWAWLLFVDVDAAEPVDIAPSAKRAADESSTGSADGARIGAKIGSVNRSISDKLGDVLSAKDFGVKCDGVADDTAAINVALKAALGKKLHFPPGNCRYAGGGVIGRGTVIEGAGRNATVILATQPSSTLLTASGYGSGLRALAFHAEVRQVGGAYVVLSGPESFIDDFHMTGDFTGILMTGNVARIRHGRFQDAAPGAIRIRAEGGDNSQMIEDVLMGAQEPEVAAAGIRVRNSAALIINNVSVLNQNIGLLIDPYTATQGTATDAGSVYSLWVNNSFFDHCRSNGIKIETAGTGSVVRSRFNDVWASSAEADGVVIKNGGTGIVAGIHFISPHLALNGAAGLSTWQGVSDVSIIGGEIAGNQYGIHQNGASSGLLVTGATIGVGGGIAGNKNAGIVLASGSDQIAIIGNKLDGNGSVLADAAVAATNKTVEGNVGFITRRSGSAVIPAGTNSVVVTHGLSKPPAIHDIILSRATVGAGSGDLYVSNVSPTQFTISTSSNAGANIAIVWQVRLSAYGN